MDIQDSEVVMVDVIDEIIRALNAASLIRPSIYLGYNELVMLKQHKAFVEYVRITEDNRLEFSGLPVYCVDVKSHLKIA